MPTYTIAVERIVYVAIDAIDANAAIDRVLAGEGEETNVETVDANVVEIKADIEEGETDA